MGSAGLLERFCSCNDDELVSPLESIKWICRCCVRAQHTKHHAPRPQCLCAYHNTLHSDVHGLTPLFRSLIKSLLLGIDFPDYPVQIIPPSLPSISFPDPFFFLKHHLVFMYLYLFSFSFHWDIKLRGGRDPVCFRHC